MVLIVSLPRYHSYVHAQGESSLFSWKICYIIYSPHFSRDEGDRILAWNM